jgi:hypothetical protein
MGLNLAAAVHGSLDYPDKDPASKAFFNQLAASHKLASGIAYLGENSMFTYNLKYYGYELCKVADSKFERPKKVKKQPETAQDQSGKQDNPAKETKVA